jgi:hypothetical protein
LARVSGGHDDRRSRRSDRVHGASSGDLARGITSVKRIAVFGAALFFIAGFAFLTLRAVAEQGFTLDSLLSVFVLVLLGVGIVGALLSGPRQ